MTETKQASFAGPWFVLAGVWLIYFGFGVIMAAMGPLITPISAELGIGRTTMGAILGAWPFVYIIASVPCGLLLDWLGARRVLFLAALIMAASSWARGMADTPLQLFLAVGLFGVGGPMISIGAPKVIAGLFTGKNRATAMGVYVTGPYLGALSALALTNSVAMPLVDGDWRAVMQLYAALVATIGFAWLALSGGGRMATSDEGGKKFELGAFAEILKQRTVQLVLGLSIGIFFINHALNNWLPEILRERGMSAVDAGYWAAIPAAIGVLGALTIPRLATPKYRLAVMAALVCATIAASLLLHFGPGLALGSGLFLQGIARGSMMTVAILILMEAPDVPKERLGLAGGLFFTAAEFGGVTGPSVFGFLADVSGGFALSFVSMSVVCVILLVLVAGLRREQARAWKQGRLK